MSEVTQRGGPPSGMLVSGLLPPALEISQSEGQQVPETTRGSTWTTCAGTSRRPLVHFHRRRHQPCSAVEAMWPRWLNRWLLWGLNRGHRILEPAWGATLLQLRPAVPSLPHFWAVLPWGERALPAVPAGPQSITTGDTSAASARRGFLPARTFSLRTSSPESLSRKETTASPRRPRGWPVSCPRRWGTFSAYCLKPSF